MESECLPNMFNSIAEAGSFAEKYSGHKKTYSCTIEASGGGKKSVVMVRKTRDVFAELESTQKGYKKEFEIIKKEILIFFQ